MKTTRSTAERVRPILEAMERSIENARRRRLHDAGTPVTPRPILGEHEPVAGQQPRQKARPKRAGPMLTRFNGSDYRPKVV